LFLNLVKELGDTGHETGMRRQPAMKFTTRQNVQKDKVLKAIPARLVRTVPDKVLREIDPTMKRLSQSDTLSRHSLERRNQ